MERKTQLWIHNVETDKERILTPGRKAPQLLAVVSPDQRHVFLLKVAPAANMIFKATFWN